MAIGGSAADVLLNAAMKDIAIQIQITVGVPAMSLMAPNTKGDAAAPKFITVMFTSCANPLLSGGLVASSMGPVDNCEITVKGKQAYSKATKIPNVAMLAGAKAMYSSAVVTMPVMTLPNMHPPARPSLL